MTATDLGDGIWRITAPLPFPAPKSVNCYVFEGREGLTMLDCGVETEVGLASIAAGLDTVGGVLTTLIGSHLHVDHMASAGHLVAETGARFVMHETTSDEVPLYNDWGVRADALAAAATANGAPPEFATALRTQWERPDWYGTAIDPTDPVADGDRIALDGDRYLTVVYTPGHQRNHICLIDSRTGLLFSGDHVLPRISPFVPYTGPESDHLGDYLDSIDRIVEMEATLTHPAHGSEIERGSERAHQIALHHSRRLEDMVHHLESGPATAWSVMEATFRPNLSFIQQRLAIQESLAHLEHLRRRGRIRVIGDPQLWLYERTGR